MSVVVVAGLLSACSREGASASQGAVAATHAVAATPRPDVETTGSTGQVEATPAVGGPRPVAVGASTAEPQYHVVATREAAAPPGREVAPRFHVFGTHGGEVYVAYGLELLRATADGALERDTRPLRGVKPPASGAGEELVDWAIHSVAGRGPDALHLSTRRVVRPRGSGRALTEYASFRSEDDRWQAYDRGPLPAFARVEPWIDGALLTLVNAEGATGGGALVVLSGHAAAPRVEAPLADFDALASGHFVGLVRAAADAVVYDAKAQSARESPLPEAAGAALRGVVLPRPERAYVFGGVAGDADGVRSPYLARYDGDAWRRERAPPCGDELLAVSWSEIAGLYALCRNHRDPGATPTGDLWRLISGGWIEVELPLRGSVTSVVAEGPDGVWIATTEALYGPQRPAEIRVFNDSP